MTGYPNSGIYVNSASTALYSDSGHTTTVNVTEFTAVLEVISFPSSASGYEWVVWPGLQDGNSVVQPVCHVGGSDAYLNDVVFIGGVGIYKNDLGYYIGLNAPYLAEMYWWPGGGGVDAAWYLQWFDANTLSAVTAGSYWAYNDPNHTPPSYYPGAQVVKETQVASPGITTAAESQFNVQVTSLQVNTGAYTTTDYVNWSDASGTTPQFGETCTVHNGTSNGTAWCYFSY